MGYTGTKPVVQGYVDLCAYLYTYAPVRDTVELPNNGKIGSEPFVFYNIEIVSFWKL